MDFMKMLDRDCGAQVLQQHIDLERGEAEQKYYCGKAECEICHCDFTEQSYLIDCQIKGHEPAWSLMCSGCYYKHGTPTGQVYKKQSNGKWLKVGFYRD